MRIRSFLSPLAVAAFVVASRPASAQQLAVASDYARPALAAPTIATNATLRTIAIYRFDPSRAAGMPSEVTVADSSGTIVASYRTTVSGIARPMQVDALAADVLLEADTPAGLLTIVLYQIGDPRTSSALLGRWMLGDKQGELLRRATR